VAQVEPNSAAVAPQAAPVTATAVADPGALGLAGFATTTFVLSFFNAGLINASVENVVIPLAFFFGGTAQLLAGMWEFRRNNTLGATAFSAFGAFWLAFALYVWQIAPHLDPAHAYQATGVFLLAWAIFTAYLTLAAMRSTGATLAVLAALTITFIVLTIGAFAQSDGITKVGGWIGLVTAVLAWYASAASVTNATWGRSVLPVWPLSR
jgi:uncharacterized protein